MIQEDSIILKLIAKEKTRQEEELELIASENFVSAQVAAATGSILTNKYAEGLPGKRYYGGCQIVDEIESLAIERAKALFDVDWVNVQPHSGSQANAALMMAVLKPGDKILGFNLSHGGHLTHGSSVNFSGKLYQSFFYGVNRETGCVEWEQVAQKAREVQPVMIICGASAYSRDWDYARLRVVADEVRAFLWADIAHPAGLISQGLLNNPFPYCHFVTTTTHKTLRGPRGGMILMGKDFKHPFCKTDTKGRVQNMSTLLDAAVFPGTQGGPLVHSIAAKAIACYEAMTSDFKTYAIQVQKNAKVMARALMDKGYTIISNGTDNHLLLLDLSSKNITGKQAEAALQKAAITTNKNLIPFDRTTPQVTSGIRLGTAAVTTRGLVASDMLLIVEWIDDVLKNIDNEHKIKNIKKAVNRYMRHFPLTTVDHLN
ncbi:MAG: serine hydroxymethyltransferase [Candidatus Cardinium sp.]|uniref:serine hydroxymethyltransferase n=1 Tax=Candidatus Cardinium sp. TP TaxID=2961955 RepID=UPI0021B0439F|nr:serine hydroxymethyltransferase [Candidatus Cardinium sp. TP]MCT4697425.1 serine hydroxymethyltransferase [Candidatus Cardinium sp. TP]MDN5247314.1 serine hydroxymethyltransferase [Candidatus Cardinium sp.]